LPDFGAKHVEFGDCRIRLDEEEKKQCPAAGHCFATPKLKSLPSVAVLATS
jgi:hypothetical protein